MNRVVQLIGFIIISISIPTYLIINEVNNKVSDEQSKEKQIKLERDLVDLRRQKSLDSLSYIHRLDTAMLHRRFAMKNDSVSQLIILQKAINNMQVARIRDSANAKLDYILRLSDLKEESTRTILELARQNYLDTFAITQIDRILDTISNEVSKVMTMNDTKTDYIVISIGDTTDLEKRISMPIDESYRSHYKVIDLTNASENLRWIPKNRSSLYKNDISGLNELDGYSQNRLRFLRVPPKNSKRFVFEFRPSEFDFKKYSEIRDTIQLIPNKKIVLIFEIERITNEKSN